MSPEELLEVAGRLQPAISIAELRAAEVVPESGIWVARDSQAKLHLLILVDGPDVIEPIVTHGMTATVSKNRIAGVPDAKYVDLACVTASIESTFASVAADLATATAGVPPGLRREPVTRTLAQWRWFWGNDPAALSSAAALGLFGELWFLVRWAGASAESVAAWTGSDASRHDFQWPQHSAEVKTTSRAGPVTHNITSLDQLDDAESGDLYLFSLRLARDALAANSLSSLVATATQALAKDPESLRELQRSLAARGFTPAARELSEVPYRVVDETFYRVSDNFPRILRSSFVGGVPAAVAGVSYQLDMGACAAWKVSLDAWPPG